MNFAEYQQFQESFEDFMQCEELDVITPATSSEMFFSKVPCDCCRRSLAGYRETCTGYNSSAMVVVDGYEICSDCIYYATYGVLDDATVSEFDFRIS